MTRNTKHKMKQLMASGLCRNVAAWAARKAALESAGTISYGLVSGHASALLMADDLDFFVESQGRTVWVNRGTAIRIDFVPSYGLMDGALIRSCDMSSAGISIEDMRHEY